MALSKSGKKVSERHEIASRHKSTLGEVSQKLRQKYKRTDIKATYVKSVFIDYYQKLPEWHHSGFFNSGSEMGKTFFFAAEQEKEFVENFLEIESRFLFRQEELIYGFFWEWVKNAEGRKVKELRPYFGKRSDAPSKNFTECDEPHYQEVLIQGRRHYTGYDEPCLEDFSPEGRNKIYAFYYEWVDDGGKKVKKLCVYHGPKTTAPKNSTVCSEEVYIEANKQVGKIYKGWDEPKIGDFVKNV